MSSWRRPRQYSVRAPRVVYITSLDDVAPAIADLLAADPEYVGFDIERGRSTRSVATLQVATSDVVLVIQTASFAGEFVNPLSLFFFSFA